VPGFNGTGPHGMGPMTGRGMGYCIIPLSTEEQALNFLKNRKQALREELEQIETRIRSLEVLRANQAVRSKQ